MKFYAKILVAAVAMSVSSMASAALSSTGDGSLFLTLIDTTNKNEIFFDTGFTYSQFNEIGNGTDTNWGSSTFADGRRTFDLSTNTTFLNFIATADLANTIFTVFAGDNAGTQTVFGSRGFISSYDTSVDLANVNISRANIVDINAGHDFAVNNSPFDNSSFGQYYGDSLIKGYNLPVAAALGTDLGLVQFSNNTNNSSRNFAYPSAIVSFNQQGLFAISPVPEADTSALFLAGLGLMGVIARRRKATK